MFAGLANWPRAQWAPPHSTTCKAQEGPKRVACKLSALPASPISASCAPRSLKWSYISCVGLLEVERRVGMADAFHCYDSVAKHALNIHEEDASSHSSGSSDDVVEDVDAAEPRSGFSQWVRTCRVLRKLLGRGHGNHFLSEAYKTFGIAGRPKITLPGTAVRRCVSNGMWLSRPAAGRRPAVPGFAAGKSRGRREGPGDVPAGFRPPAKFLFLN